MTNGTSLAELSAEFGIPEEDAAELVEAALVQLDVQVADFLREPETFFADRVTGLQGLIEDNAIDMALPRGLEREDARALVGAVIGPRLERIEENPEEFDIGGAVRRTVEEVFPIEVEERDDSVRSFKREIRLQTLPDDSFELGLLSEDILEEKGFIPLETVFLGETKAAVDFSLPEIPPSDVLNERRIPGSLFYANGVLGGMTVRPPLLDPDVAELRSEVKERAEAAKNRTRWGPAFWVRVTRPVEGWHPHYKFNSSNDLVKTPTEAATAARDLVEAFIEEFDPEVELFD